MTYEEASQLEIGDRIKLDRNGQTFEIVGIPPHPPKKIMLLLKAEDDAGTRTFIDEVRLHLFSRAGTRWKPGVPEGDNAAEQLTDALHKSVEGATTDLTGGAPEDLQEALEESVDAATEDVFAKPAPKKDKRAPRGARSARKKS